MVYTKSTHKLSKETSLVNMPQMVLYKEPTVVCDAGTTGV